MYALHANQWKAYKNTSQLLNSLSYPSIMGKVTNDT